MVKHYKYNPKLSTGFRQAARFSAQNPSVVLGMVRSNRSMPSHQLGTHPSRLVRLAKNLG
jgi:prephenate dehydrogenase